MPRFAFPLAAALWLASGASMAASESAPLRVFDATELTMDRYRVIDRLPARTWRSSFYVPSYANATDAVNALVDQARDLGADALVDLHCLRGAQSVLGNGGHFCYANAVKLK